MATPLPPSSGDAETSALDQAEQAIIEGKEQVSEQRDRALADAETTAQRDAINQRFDAIEAQLGNLHNQVSESVTQSTAGLAGELRSIREQLSEIGRNAGGSDGAGATDDILSIEEIADDIGEAAGGAADAVAGAGGEVAETIDKAPARGHALFRRRFGGG